MEKTSGRGAEIGLGELAVKTAIVHMVTYFLMGILAFNLLGYTDRFQLPYMACWMRPTDSPVVTAGVLFQPIRGLIFALAFYPLREILFGRKNGWLIMAGLLVGLGIFSTFGPTPGSVEGLVYTVIPVTDQLLGWLEVVPQALLLSFILFQWVRHPQVRWLNWLLGIFSLLVVAMAVLGLVFG